ncbi:GHKL domain-containing protein [Carnobacterium viridans]|uniref:histidine kinase n=1 Tax=Carnobacterium viridans TaxID=174587 RepID=A0A1H1AP08_9LACT|nr:ATP-binding protein [Carnobacterium viridans]UDE96130.1 GHKL domain-containing protein [Carnobacterium viridans]SDQ40906.1 histidine kinase [Carnobacterium viridans]
MRKLQFRILAIFIAIFTIFSLSIGLFSINLLQDYAGNSQEEELIKQAKTIASLLPMNADNPTNLEAVTNEATALEMQSDERLTIIDLSGVVVFDSATNREDLENHSNREEFQAVLAGNEVGVSARNSESTNETLYYVAVPLLGEQNELTGVLRLSRPVAEINQISEQIKHSLLLFSLLALILTTLITLIITKRIARPINDIMIVAKSLSDKQYEVRYNGNAYGEVADLGQTINELATSLEEQTQEIEQNDKRLFELINHLVIGVMLIDEHRTIKMVNPAMSVILGEDVTKLVGNSYVEATKSYGLSHLIEVAYQQNKKQNDEIYFYYPKDKIVDANIVPIDGKEPGEQNLIVLLYDITEIRRLEKVRTDFVTNASHELKTPVTALKGFSETLLDGAMEDKEVLKQFLEIMLAESSRLDFLVNDILELSKLEQKQVPMNMQEVNLSEAVLATFQLVKQTADEKEMELNLLEEDTLFITVDNSRLKQILANLINNAVVYTQESGKVTVTIRKENDQAVILVSDNGIGIPEDEQDRIFERFYRVDKARSRNSGGTGLGLSIVKYLVENLNGSITIKSKLGLGTTFIVRLPIQPR